MLIALLAAAAAGLGFLGSTPSADAEIIPTVPLATAADYSVLAGETVTNTGPTVVPQSVGVSPGSAVTGFPPGIVVLPGVVHAADAAALQAQNHLTTAYDNAAGRSLTETTTDDLGGLTLVGGTYSGPNPELQLTGNLTLDGLGDPNSVFIFQAQSTLTTASASSVTLVNGAQACNVFWQVGSSATIGTGTIFVGNIMALTSISVTTGATIEGRALARTGQVSLDTNVFTTPSCDLTTVPPPTTSSSGPATSAPDTPPTTPPGEAVTTAPGPGDTAVIDTAPAESATTFVGAPSSVARGTIPPGITLPQTGRPTRGAINAAAGALVLGSIIMLVARRGRSREF
jgi:LPXTG-motif cell wall-anchored protein